MTYYNWQKLHKEAYKRQLEAEVRAVSEEESRSRAWDYLRRHCSQTELEALFALAQRYAANPEALK